MFLIAHAVPADPVAAFAGPHADKEARDLIRRELHLDDPLATQYGRFLWGAVAATWAAPTSRKPVLGAILRASRRRWPCRWAGCRSGCSPACRSAC